eukprot:285368_1
MGNNQIKNAANEQLKKEKQDMLAKLQQTNEYNEMLGVNSAPWIKLAPIPQEFYQGRSNTLKAFPISDGRFIIFTAMRSHYFYIYDSLRRKWIKTMLQNVDFYPDNESESLLAQHFTYSFHHHTYTLYVIKWKGYYLDNPRIYKINLNKHSCIVYHATDSILMKFSELECYAYALQICTENELHLIGLHPRKMLHIKCNIMKQTQQLEFTQISDFYLPRKRLVYGGIKCVYLKSKQKIILFDVVTGIIYEYCIIAKDWEKKYCVNIKKKYYDYEIFCCKEDRFMLIIFQNFFHKNIYVYDTETISVSMSCVKAVHDGHYTITEHSRIITIAFCENIPDDIVNIIHNFVGIIEYLHALDTTNGHYKVCIDYILQNLVNKICIDSDTSASRSSRTQSPR